MKPYSAYIICIAIMLFLGCDNGTPTSPAITYSVPAQGLSVLAPSSGQHFKVGDTMMIEWTIDTAKVSNGVSMKISPNNGGLWLPVDPLLLHTIHQNDSSVYGGTIHGSYRWVVVDSLTNLIANYSIVSDSCKVQLYAPYNQDSLGVPYQAASGGIFSITR